MKKICMILAAVLLLSCGLIYRNAQQINALRETEQQLTLENEKLDEQLDLAVKSIEDKKTEIENLNEEKKPVLEARDLWKQRTEEIHGLLSE